MDANTLKLKCSQMSFAELLAVKQVGTDEYEGLIKNAAQEDVDALVRNEKEFQETISKIITIKFWNLLDND